MERNARHFKRVSKSSDVIVKEIEVMIRVRVVKWKKGTRRFENWMTCMNWGIPESSLD